jgi:hypothetical protein
MQDSIKDDEADVQSGEPWQARFQFPLYKLFLVMAAYAVSFAVFGSHEKWQIVIASWVGTAVGGWILAARTSTELLRSLIALVGALVGGYISEPISSDGASPDLIIWPIVGALLGSLLFAGTGRIAIKRKDKL